VPSTQGKREEKTLGGGKVRVCKIRGDVRSSEERSPLKKKPRTYTIRDETSVFRLRGGGTKKMEIPLGAQSMEGNKLKHYQNNQT